MNNNNQQNNEKQLLCLNDRQTTWCICLSIVLLCIIMVTSYIAGYRSAIRNVTDAAKKNSFADQVYTSVSSAALADHEAYYVQCKITDNNNVQKISEIGEKEGISLSLLTDFQSPEKEDKCYYLVSSMMQTHDEAIAIVTALKNKINIDDQNTIITVQKTQKLKGYLS